MFFNLHKCMHDLTTEDKYLNLSSDTSWVDYDIVFIDTDLNFLNLTDDNSGIISLGSSASQLLLRYISHIKKEINRFIDSGKTLVFLINKNQNFIDNYNNFLPNYFNNNEMITGCLSGLYKHRGKNFSVTKNFPQKLLQKWESISSLIRFECRLVIPDIVPILTDREMQPVAGYLERKSGAKLVFFPSLQYDLIVDNDSEDFVIDFLESLSIEISNSNLKEDYPAWVNENENISEGEKQILNKIEVIDERIITLELEKKILFEDLSKFDDMKPLLFANGHDLENAVIKCLNMLGLTAEKFEDAHREFDAVFTFEGVRVIGEVEGKDNKAISITKFDQLERNRRSDFNRDEVEKKAKGILFGNGFRLMRPSERECEFTAKCLEEAKSTESALVRTSDLYKIATYLMNNNDEDYRAICRDLLISTNGKIVEFPDP